MKSFPQPLTASEERAYLQKYTEGDLEAKHILIERNLRPCGSYRKEISVLRGRQ